MGKAQSKINARSEIATLPFATAAGNLDGPVAKAVFAGF